MTSSSWICQTLLMAYWLGAFILPVMASDAYLEHSENKPSATIALIFVHGFTGDVTTFTNGKSEKSWMDIIKSDATEIAPGLPFSDVNIYSIAHPSHLGSNFSIYDLSQLVKSSIDAISTKQYQHIFIVAHSLGGLIVKKAVVNLEPHRLKKIRAIALMASPAGGSNLANYLSTFGIVLGPIAAELSPGGSTLEQIEEQWGELVQSKSMDVPGLRILIAYETRAIKNLPRHLDKVVQTLGLIIVDKLSATATYKIAGKDPPPVGLEETHISIVKPFDDKDQIHVWLRGNLNNICSKLAFPHACEPLADKRAPLHSCDKYAAHPDDPDKAKGITGVWFGAMSGDAAKAYCEEAVASFPNDPRLSFQLGRALLKQENYDEARQIFAGLDKENDSRGALGLGLHAREALPLQERTAQAERWFRKAADAKNIAATALLGDLLVFDIGLGQESKKAEGLELLQMAADAGSAPALTSLAWREYLDHRAKTEISDEVKARILKNLKLAADVNFPTALNNLGHLYEEGRFVAKNNRLARDYFRRASAGGDPFGKANYGRFLILGIAGEEDVDEGRKLILDAAGKSNHEALRILCQLQVDGVAVGRDYKAAIKNCTKAVVYGSPRANVIMGDLYGLGRGVQVNLQKAATYYGDGEKLGDEIAITRLGWAFENGWVDGKENLVEAERRFRIAAAQGEPGAHEHLARVIDERKIAPVGNETAEYHRIKAIELGSPTAALELAIQYRDGKGVPKDRSKSAEYFALAGEAGIATAYYYLGALYEMQEQEGGFGKPDEAARWYQRALEAGVVNSSYPLANLYLEGRGVPKDEEKAAQLLREGAEHGLPESQFRLSEFLFTNGENEERQSEARVWLKSAAAAGHLRASLALAERLDRGSGGFERSSIAAAHIASMALDAGAPIEPWEKNWNDWSVSFRSALQTILSDRGRYGGPNDGKWSASWAKSMEAGWREPEGEAPE